MKQLKHTVLGKEVRQAGKASRGKMLRSAIKGQRLPEGLSPVETEGS